MVIRSVIVFVLLAVTWVYAAGLRAGRAAPGGIPDLGQLPRELNGWSSEEFATDSVSAAVLDADATVKRAYRQADGAEIGLFVAYFAQQQVNSQIHSPRNCLPGGGWRVAAIEETRLALGQEVQPATRMTIRRPGGAPQEVLYWFRTGHGPVAGEYALKWNLVRTSLARRPTNAAFVRYNAAAADSAALRDLMGQLEPRLDALLGPLGLP